MLIVDSIGWTDDEYSEEERIMGICLHYDGCWNRFKLCKDYP